MGTVETLAKLRPAFIRDASGTVTAGNASGMGDGAAVVMLMTAEAAASRQLSPMGRIVSSAVAGLDPAIMGTGPVPAVKKALAKAGWSVDDVDVFELNEAFASQSLAVVKDLGVPAEKVNVQGGSIALGHTAPRHEEKRSQERMCFSLYRRRNGYCHVRGGCLMNKLPNLKIFLYFYRNQ